jgi:hypothetical protein
MAEPFENLQGYVKAAPEGINARFAWGHQNGGGAGVRFVDLEKGWHLNHEDLPAITPFPNTPTDIDPDPLSRAHGTAVLGVVAGPHNGKGIAGIAKTPKRVSLVSHFRPAVGNTPASSGHVADTLMAILPHLGPGDVLLIEWQTTQFLPAETEPGVFAHIDSACDDGVVVVEAAGNASKNLDTVEGLRPLDLDSGAIIVAACHSAVEDGGHERLGLDAGPPSNFGSRVDCYAWGENVGTAGPGSFPPNTVPGVIPPNTFGHATDPALQYRDNFSRTSSAAAIIAGAAVVLQGMHIAKHGVPLDPKALRRVFRHFGTPAGPRTKARGQHIGIMPDLGQIAQALGL